MLKTSLTETKGSLQQNIRFEEEEATRWGSRQRRLDPKGKKRYFEEGLCFQCGKPGHIGRHCPNRKQPMIPETKRIIQREKDKGDSPDSKAPDEGQACIKYLKQQRIDKRLVLTRTSNEQGWPGRPWVNSQIMMIKLKISTEEKGWQEAQYSYWKIYHGIPTLWGTMGVGHPVYHKPTYLIRKTRGKETHRGPPILQTVFQGELIYEQDIFNDMQMQTAEHSIYQDWKALKKDQQLHQ